MKERPILFSAPMVRALLDGSKTQTRRIVKPQPTPEYSVSEFCDWESDFDGSGVKSVKFSPPFQTRGEWRWWPEGEKKITCPYGQIGDRLNVKEHAWMWCEKIPNGKTDIGRPKFKYVPLLSAPVIYCADHPHNPEIDVVSEHRGNTWGWRKKLGRYLPSWASRIQLEITGVRVERLQDIEGDTEDESDALKEGIHRIHHGDGEYGYSAFRSDPHPENWNHPECAFRELWESINGDGSWAKNPWVWVIEFRRVAP